MYNKKLHLHFLWGAFAILVMFALATPAAATFLPPAECQGTPEGGGEQSSTGTGDCPNQAGESSSTQSSVVVDLLSRGISQQRSLVRLQMSDPGSALLGPALGGAAGGSIADTGRASIFLIGDITRVERDETVGGRAFDQDIDSLTLGFDYRLSPTLFLGAIVSYISSETELDANAGTFDTDGWMLGFHGANYFANDVFVDWLLSYGWSDIDIDRFDGADSHRASTDGEQRSVDITVGYEYSVDRWRLTPAAKFTHVRGEIDGYDERVVSGGFGSPMSVNRHRFETQVFDLSLQADYVVLANWGVLIPSARLAYQRDESDAGKTTGVGIFGSFSERADDPNRNTMLASLGASAQFRHGWSAFLNADYLFEHGFMDRYSVSLGVRYELPTRFASASLASLEQPR